MKYKIKPYFATGKTRYNERTIAVGFGMFRNYSYEFSVEITRFAVCVNLLMIYANVGFTVIDKGCEE